MGQSDEDIRLWLSTSIIVGLFILVFFAVKAVILSVLAGLLLAYIFMPIFKKIDSKVNNRNISASIVLLIALLVLIIPLWLIVPIIANQVFEIFKLTQGVDVQTAMINLAEKIIPTASDQFLIQLTIAINNLVSESTTLVLGWLVQFFLEIPKILMHTFIIFFVFYYALKDAPKLKEFVKEVSPISKSKEKILVKQFRDITDSLIYGQVIVGLVQGLLAGIGFWIFGVPNAFVLGLMAVIFAIIPILGPAILWIPISIYLLVSGNLWVAVIFIIYNVIIVSTADNILRAHIVSKKAKLSPVIVLVGMIGGLFIFGILGLILGPLILAYFLTFLTIYKNKTLKSIFAEKDE